MRPAWLGGAKDIVLDAQVQQRRWERAFGVAIREGQERGLITTGGGDRRSSPAQKDLKSVPRPRWR